MMAGEPDTNRPAVRTTSGAEEDDLLPTKNMYHKTRAKVTNLLDAALMISNFSNMAGIYKRRQAYAYKSEFGILMGALTLSIVFQIVAAVSFMLIKYSENEQHKLKPSNPRFDIKRRHKNRAKVTSIVMVFVVMVLNIFIGVFANVWDVKLDISGGATYSPDN